MKHLVLISAILSFCSYEAAAEENESGYISVRSDNYSSGSYYKKSRDLSALGSWLGHPAAYNQVGRVERANEQNLHFFIQKLSNQLLGNLKYVTEETPLAVSTFVMLNGDMASSDIVGKQISESFVHEIYKSGLSVIDFKVTDYMRVTPDGDFIISRDFLELKENLPIQYVLAGTLVKHRSGHLINARIVGLRSKAVVASAQGFIPEYITAALLGTHIKDGVIVY